MALIHSVPQTVTEGLVLYLDPANIKSYPGSGNTLNDMTSNQINLSGTTLNTTTDAGATVFNFNGSTQISSTFTPISNSGPDGQNAWSLAWWSRSTGTTSSNYRAVIRLRDTNYLNTNHPGYFLQIDTRETTNSRIHNYQKMYDGSTSESAWSASTIATNAEWTSGSWFCQGISHVISPVLSKPIFTTFNNGAQVNSRINNLAFSGYGNVNYISLNTANGNTVHMGPVAIYNRRLSQPEFKQFFDAHKVRFGY